MKFSRWWIIPICAVAAFVLALILGSVLGKKVDSSDPAGSSSESGTETEYHPEPIEAPSVDGIYVTLRGVYGDTYDAVDGQIPKGTQAVSLELFDDGGSPLYNSAVAERFSEANGINSLSDIFDAVGDTYASVIFPSASLTESDGAIRPVLYAYEAALISELYLAGADDVIVTVAKFGTDGSSLVGDDFCERAAAFLSAAKRETPDIAVGFALTFGDVSFDYSSEAGDALAHKIESLSDSFDFLAADLTAFTDEDDLRVALNDAGTTLMRHGMRVLLSGGDEKTLMPIKALLDKFGLSSRQTVTEQIIVY